MCIKIWADYIKWLCLNRDYPDHRIVYLSEHDIGQWKRKIFQKRINHCSYDYSKLSLYKNDKTAIEFITTNHYLGCIRSGTIYSLHEQNKIVAAYIVSPLIRNEVKLSDNKRAGEISRMVAIQGIANNLLSYLLAKVTRNERNKYDGLIAFADPSPVRKGEHYGTVYKASNFKFNTTELFLYKSQPQYNTQKNNIIVQENSKFLKKSMQHYII